MFTRIKPYLPTVILCAILLLAAFFRLYNIDKYLTFLGDEGRDVLVVKRMIVDHKWTLLGPTASVGGFFMGPAYYYFMLPFLWLWKLDPVGPAVMVALVGVLTVYLVYRMGREMMGERMGLAAALMYALSPLVISYSRSSWNPNIVPFFSTAFAYLLWKMGETGKWKHLFWVGVIAGIGIQLHYTFMFLFPMAAIWVLWKAPPQKEWRNYLLACTGFVVGFAPFLGFELRHGFANTRAIFSFLSGGKDTGFSAVRSVSIIADVFYRLFARLILRIPETGMLITHPKYVQLLWSGVSWSLALASLAALIRSVRRKSSSAILLLVWLCSVLLLFGFYKKPIYDYYFGIAFAVPFLMVANLLGSLRSFGWGKYAVPVLLAAIVIFNLGGQPFQYPANDQLGQAKKIARAVLDHTDGRPFNFALITGGNSDHAYRYFFEIWGHPPVTIENEAVDPQRKSIQDQLLIVCEYPNCQPLGNSLWEVAGFGRAQIAGQWDVSVVTIYRLVHYTGADK